MRRERAEQRTRTVGSLLRYVATIAIYTVAILMALSELGLDIAPLIASAGIAGIALGFGAQSLVKDFLSGTFMLIEDQFGVGDVVDLGEASGTVERVTLRVTTVRGVDGTVWYVPNGQIVRVGNKSQRWARTVLDVEVAYDTDIEHASEVIKRVADEFWKERVHGATVIEEPELWGVQNVSPNVVVLRLAVKTRPGEQWAAGRALRARLKAALDEAGIVAPLPVQTMWMPGGAAGGSATGDASAPGDDASPGGANAGRLAGGRSAVVTRYRDTRGLVERPRTFTEALLDGIAPGGGLYVPERLPSLTASDLVRLSTQRYADRAATIYEAFGLDVAPDRIADIAALAYGDNFDDPEVAPVRDLGDGRFVLELWHGPTLAFKDMALQCMPLFFCEALELAHARGTTDLDFLILVATSGDTGVAALNGFADRAHTRIAVCYPDAGVSAIQERQMVTQPGGNLTVFAVEGDFDACQSAVKAVFDDEAFAADLAARHGLALSSANSINWGRLLPQIVYYVSAYADMAARGHVPAGDPIDVCVPTGNFGDILAAYYAKRMGVPIGRLLCASNTNNVLADFIATGVYDISRREPGEDAVTVDGHPHLVQPRAAALRPARRRRPSSAGGWSELARGADGSRVDDETLRAAAEEFVGDWVDNDTCLRTIGARAAREGLPDGPAHGGRVGGRRATSAADAARARRLDGALEQVPRRRGAGTERRA